MVELLEREIKKNGGQFRILPAERLKDLQRDIEDFRKRDDLNGFQKFITGDLFKFDLPETGFVIRSIIIIATPAPSCARVTVNRQGNRIELKSLARSYPGKKAAPEATKEYLTKLLDPLGYHIISPEAIPLKRLAVRSGLARYGRNNITYVEGMGSFLTLTAYFTDVPSESDAWYELRNMDLCSRCTACMKACPTGAILKDRFLINNEMCLSYFNESPGEFPDWLPKSVHHCIYDCLKCQNACPANKDYTGNVIGPVEFGEEETNLLLSNTSLDEFPDTLKEKVVFLGMDEWMPAIPRNLKVLLENY